MAKWLAATAVIAVALPLGAVLADEPAAGGAGRELCFELADGTVITGRTDVKVITFRIPSGNVLKVPITEITELTVGLNDRPEFVKRVEALVRALDSAKTRESARRELIALGPAVAPIVSRHLTSDVSPRRVAVGQVLKAYETWSADHGDAPEVMARPLERQSKVRAGGATLVGTVAVGRFLIASPYGRTSVKLGQVHRIRPADARVPPATAGELDQWAIEKHDKTRVKGMAISRSLRVRTRYGTMVVPFAQIQKAAFAADGKSICVQCRNSDRIAGTLEPKATISLKTDKGRTDVSVGQIAVVVHCPVTLDLGNGVTMKLVRVEAGKFMMGSKLSADEVAKRFVDMEAEYLKNEHPRHQVTITKPFYMGVTEVTQAQWRAVMNTEPWKGKEYAKAQDDHAASYITWADAAAFCTALSKKTGRTVRLPTEAQWEYAYRAGTTTMYSFGENSSKLGDYAWYRANARDKGEEHAHSVGVKKPNAWGLYDMHGNVYEWCADWLDSYLPPEGPGANAGVRDPKGPATGHTRVVRGGSWAQNSPNCRAARRYSFSPVNRIANCGVRVVVLRGVAVD